MIEDAAFIAETGGIRLDAALLSQFPSSTRAFCRAACAEGEVTVNGRPAKASYDVKVGDKISIRFGASTLNMEVLQVAETVRKDDAAGMYREI